MKFIDPITHLNFTSLKSNEFVHYLKGHFQYLKTLLTDMEYIDMINELNDTTRLIIRIHSSWIQL